MCEKTAIDEKGRVQIPPTIRVRTGWLKKMDVTVTVYGNKLVIENFVSGSNPEDTIKKTQAALKLEELFKAMHAKNFDMSDKEIVREIKEYRKERHKTG